ncbi:MAG: hypothetical protein WCH74_06460 [Chloroflexota bacterium]
MTDHRRTHRGTVAPRRPSHPTPDYTNDGRSTAVHSLHGTVARAIHEDRIREQSHPTRRTWMEAPPAGRTRQPVRARLGRSIVRLGERIAAEPALSPARPR